MSKIKLNDIHINGGTQPREDIDIDIVQEYAEAMKEGDQFPPVVVFNDGAKYWLADGFHRYHASNAIDYLEIEAEVKNGTKRDAILYSVSANAKHGLRRTNADKRKAVLTLLNDEEWSGWSDREIARQCEVSNRMVSNYREQMTVNGSQSKERKGADGRTIDTSNIGKRDIFGKKIRPDSGNGEQEDTGYDIDEPFYPETGELIEKKKEAIGFQKAYEAIAALEKIPADDEDLPQAFDLVIDWINNHKTQ